MKYENREKKPYTSVDGSVHYHMYWYPIVNDIIVNLYRELADELSYDIPNRFNLKKIAAYNDCMKRCFESKISLYSTEDVEVADVIYYYYSKNFGTKKWYNPITLVDHGVVKSVTKDHIMVAGHRLEPYQVLAIRKEV